MFVSSAVMEEAPRHQRARPLKGKPTAKHHTPSCCRRKSSRAQEMIRIEPKEAEKPAEGHQNLAGPTRRE